MADGATDAALTAMFAGPAPQRDPAFVRRIERAVRAEQAFGAARARAWRRFGGEAAATIAVTAVFALLWRFAGTPAAAAGGAGVGWAAVTMLALWFLVALRPIVRDG